jgi:hypothetical protein
MRVTRLDGCGRPDETDPDCVQVTSDGFVSIAVTANTDEGTAITVQNANGKTCINQQPCPQLLGYSVDITFCNVDPDLFALMTGQQRVTDPATGDGIGFRINTDISGCDSGSSLEVWSNVPGVVCDPDSDNSEGSYGYVLFPFLQGGIFGDFTIENDAVSFVVQGATTKGGSAWGTGPYDVTLDAAGEAGPLTEPILPGDHLHVQVTHVAPPEPSCGCGPLVPYPLSTGATAGTPGDWTPTDSTAPANLAALTGASPAIAASPNTAWTTGQSVELGDGSDAHWNGTTWVAGVAP